MDDRLFDRRKPHLRPLSERKHDLTLGDLLSLDAQTPAFEPIEWWHPASAGPR